MLFIDKVTARSTIADILNFSPDYRIHFTESHIWTTQSKKYVFMLAIILVTVKGNIAFQNSDV